MGEEHIGIQSLRRITDYLTIAKFYKECYQINWYKNNLVDYRSLNPAVNGTKLSDKEVSL